MPNAAFRVLNQKRATSHIFEVLFGILFAGLSRVRIVGMGTVAEKLPWPACPASPRSPSTCSPRTPGSHRGGRPTAVRELLVGRQWLQDLPRLLRTPHSAYPSMGQPWSGIRQCAAHLVPVLLYTAFGSGRKRLPPNQTQLYPG